MYVIKKKNTAISDRYNVRVDIIKSSSLELT